MSNEATKAEFLQEAQLGELEQVHAWIEKEFDKFIAALPKHWRSYWDSGKGGASPSSLAAYFGGTPAGPKITHSTLPQTSSLRGPRLKR
jgi:hypothetical protein